jgi:hypothetical protein
MIAWLAAAIALLAILGATELSGSPGPFELDSELTKTLSVPTLFSADLLVAPQRRRSTAAGRG